MDIKTLLSGLDAYDPARLDKSDADATRVRRSKADAVENARGDKVSFSDDARLRTEAFSSAMSAPDIRKDKVAAIKAQIAAGEYTMDSQKIAAKIVQDDLDFFGL
ncbi:flagellar biosynthesis anti-sigma factor FlgM [Megalodesulfovibrio paquesii]